MLKDAAMGMNWLHHLKPAFLHRDLKTGNLLVRTFFLPPLLLLLLSITHTPPQVDENWTVKVADFGLSSIKSLDEDGNKVTGAVGSPFYMAPEVLVDKEYDEKADVYSFAVVVWEVLSGEEPYKDEFQSFEELVEAITLDNQRPAMQAWFPPTLRAFLDSLWADSPEKRPSFQFILKERKLDTIAIDCMMKDPLANDFWKTNFSERWDSVPWSDFVKVSRRRGIFSLFSIPSDTM
jgi:serine/threonine-protein kinase CTR1